MITQENFTRINNDSNGNPRYVCHFLNFSSPVDRDADSTVRYSLAVHRARKLGGKRFHNKQYGGGIVFQCFNLQDLCDMINKLNGVSNVQNT